MHYDDYNWNKKKWQMTKKDFVRFAFVDAADRLSRECKISVNMADRLFSAYYNSEIIPVRDRIRKIIPRVSARSIKRWRALRPDVFGKGPLLRSDFWD